MLLRSIFVIAILALSAAATVSAAETRIIIASPGGTVTLPFSGVIDRNSTEIIWNKGHKRMSNVDQSSGRLTINDIQFNQSGHYVVHGYNGSRSTVTVRVVEAPRCALLLSTSDANVSQLTCAVQFSAPGSNDVPEVKWLDEYDDCSSPTDNNTQLSDGQVTRTVTSVCRLATGVLARGRLPVCRATFKDDESWAYNCSVESCPGVSVVAVTTADVPVSGIGSTVDSTSTASTTVSTSTGHKSPTTDGNSTQETSTESAKVESPDATDDITTSASSSSTSSSIVESNASTTYVNKTNTEPQVSGSAQPLAQPPHAFLIISQCLIIVLLVVIVVTLLLSRPVTQPPYQRYLHVVRASESRDQSTCDNHLSATSLV